MTDHQEFMEKLEAFVLRIQCESIKGLAADLGMHPVSLAATKTSFYKLGMPKLSKAEIAKISLSEFRAFRQWKASQEVSP